MKKLFGQPEQFDFFKKPREKLVERLKDEWPAEKEKEENYEPTLPEKEWLLKEQEGKKINPVRKTVNRNNDNKIFREGLSKGLSNGIKARDPKKEARENKKAFEKFKKGRRQKDLPF
ncbi:MAG: hypothetical protein HYW71_02260 [Candidatus Niyogibacteria bacterium]|nr:hypothetical protein [Candidatus Niyogibacteria bacterium]